MKLKPSGAEVELTYTCPKCEAVCYVDLPTVTKIGKYACWACSEILEFEPIKIIARFGNQKGVPKQKQPKRVVSQATEDVVDALCGLGYKKAQARSLVESGIEAGFNIDDPATFISNVIRS